MDNIKVPCIMMADRLWNNEKPDFIYLENGRVVTEDFDSFLDRGKPDGFRIIPMGNRRDKEEMGENAYWAFDYFYEGCDSGEYGYATEPFEDDHRREHFAALWEFLTGEALEFKGVI